MRPVLRLASYLAAAFGSGLWSRQMRDMFPAQAMRWTSRFRWLFLVVVLSVAAAQTAKADTILDADGVNGWKGATSGGPIYGATPDEACQMLWTHYAPFPNSVYTPPTQSNYYWQAWNCHWTGVPYPTYVWFECDWGYAAVPPHSCVAEEPSPQRPRFCDISYSNGPNNPTIGDPVEISTGRLMEKATDFETNDGLLRVMRHYAGRRYVPDVLDDGVLRYGGAGWAFDFGPTLRLGTFANFWSETVSLVMPEGTSYTLLRNATTGVFEASDYSFIDSATRSRWTVSLIGTPPSNWNTTPNSSTDWSVTDKYTGTSYVFRTLLKPGSSKYVWGYPLSITQRGGYAWTLAYGSENEITSITDSFGRSLSFSWLTGFGGTATYKVLIDTIGLPDGTSLKYTYSPSYSGMSGFSQYDRMEKVEHLSAGSPGTVISSTSYSYEDGRFPSALTGLTDSRNQRFASWTYDSSGKVATSEHESGVDHYSFAYTTVNSTTRTRTVTNPLGKVFVYTYSKSNNDWLLTSVAGQTSAGTPAATVSYANTNKMVSSVTDEEGYITKYTRDAVGLPSSITEAFGTSDQRVATPTWRSDRQIDLDIAPGLTTDYVYDSEGLLTSVTQTDTTTTSVPYSTNGQTRTWAYTYTTEGLVASVDGPLAGSGDTVDYTYDADGYLETVTDELGHVTEILSVDAIGRPLSVEDANGIVTGLVYSAAGFLETITVDPTGANVTTTLGYNEVGDVTSITREDGSVFTFAYDQARRLTSVTDAEGNSVNYTLNAMGGVTETKILNSGSTQLFQHTATFDELGRLLTEVGVGSANWQYAYDKTSNLVSITDPRTNVSTQAFNGLRELVGYVDQNSNTVTTTRDDQGEVINVEDDRGLDTVYVRNGWGEIIQESSPDIGTVVYERNKLGLVTKKTDARAIVANYAYDDAGRLTEISYPAASTENVTFTYDSTASGNFGVGRLTGFTDPSGVTALKYNSLGLLESESVTLLGTTFVTTYYYDDAGNLQHIIYPSGRSASYWRDAYGKINSVSTKKTSGSALEEIVNEVDWLPFSDNLRSMDFENGLNLWRTYDTGYRPDQLSLFDGSTPLIERYHGYQDNLNLTNIWDNLNSANDEAYWYSPTNELQNANGPWGDDTFYQDGVGNITWHINDNGTTTTDQLTYSGSSNRIASVVRNSSTLRTYTHDGAGNIATSVQGGVTTAYTYNNADRLASFTVGGTQIGAYKYNADGQLVVRTVTNTSPSGVTVYFYDQAGHPIAEYDGSTGSLKREYIWLGDTPIAVIDPGTPSTTYYVHTDHLNRPVAMTNSAKSFVARYVWQAFGGLASYTGTKGLDLRFPGQMLQAESGLHYNWFRTYDPVVGRYTQPDPLGLKAGINRYAYVGNDPLQKIDPMGLIMLPGDPAGLPDGWVPDPSHRNPNGKRYRNSEGGCLDFEPGQPGLPGWRGKPHWHDCTDPSDKKRGDKHREAGEQCPLPGDPIPMSTPSLPPPISPPNLEPWQLLLLGILVPLTIVVN